MKLPDIIDLNILLDTIKLKEFSVDELKDILNLKRELKKIVTETDELKVELMKKWDIPFGERGYNYQGHPKQDEIDKDVKKITDEEYKINSKLNFLTFEQIKAGLKEEHTASNILTLTTFLTK